MAHPVPPPVAKNLRQLAARVISDESAYDVPALCRRLGLSDGTVDEAFRSKYKYAHKRMLDVPGERVLEIARELAEESGAFELCEEIAKLDELIGADITELTRRRLLAVFKHPTLATELPDIELIRRVWPIAKMQAPDHSDGVNLEDFIIRHSISNDDLSNRELLEILGLLNCSRARLFKFLVAVTAPEVQSPERQAELVSQIDKLLRMDGYALVVGGKRSGSPHYKVQLLLSGSPADQTISTALAAFDTTQVHARWSAALERRSADPPGAITLARTLLEDVCKWILHDAGETWPESDDLPALYRKLSKTLRLAPDDHTEQVFKQILGSCQSVVESLGALRNKLGDAHSSGPKRARPQPRHAELAVNLAGAMATFLVATWEARRT